VPPGGAPWSTRTAVALLARRRPGVRSKASRSAGGTRRSSRAGVKAALRSRMTARNAGSSVWAWSPSHGRPAPHERRYMTASRARRSRSETDAGTPDPYSPSAGRGEAPTNANSSRATLAGTGHVRRAGERRQSWSRDTCSCSSSSPAWAPASTAQSATRRGGSPLRDS
jgi:hypothetical protein